MIDVQKTLEKYEPINKIPFKNRVVEVVKKIVHEDEINNFLEKTKDIENFEFIEEVLKYFNFQYKLTASQIENIPKTGRCVVIANHPLGALDALSLIDMISKVRKDVKIVANNILNSFTQIQDLLIPTDVFKNTISKESIKKIYESLENEEIVIFFPSGEVSRIRPNGVKDTKWNKGFLKVATKTSSPVLPIYIKAKNSAIFYTISAINKKLSTLFLANEMFKQKNKTIEFVIGELIPYESFNSLAIDSKSKVKLFQKHLYRIAKNKKPIFKTITSIAHPEERKLIKNELKNAELLSETTDGKKIYLFTYQKDSAVMKEIARLREYTFRKVEEGTGKKRDTDKYDKYYKHIVLWDEEELEIVGSYRIGESELIMQKYGKKGFYSNTLFEYEKEFEKFLTNSIELGRSFVQPKYWGSRALDYLWQGIGAYLKQHPEIKYMFGPVSLSKAYNKLAQSMIVYYYDKYYGKRGYVTAKEPFKIDRDSLEEFKELFNKDVKADFVTLKKQLMCQGLSVPTLYKQYTDLCEEGGIVFCDYNVDKDFNDCVDSFILVDIDKIKPKKREKYIR